MNPLKAIQTEIDTAFLYQKLAENESDEGVANVFRQMSDIELGHANAFLNKYFSKEEAETKRPHPSARAKILNLIGKTFGYDYVLGVVMDTEKSISNAVLVTKKKENLSITGVETNHVKILKNLLEKDAGTYSRNVSRFEKRHKSVGGNALRAAVLGGNDGLVSNFSLVMGVAGATSGQKEILLTGMAGLLAGALSMAMGEWISVKSSQELYENQMDLEMEELETNPEGEKKEMKLIFMAKGIDEERAASMAEEMMKDKGKAHELLVREELGIDPSEMEGSAIEAAVYSFLMFAVGAILPVIPFFFFGGDKAVLLCIAFSTVGLFFIGAAITLFTNKNVWYSGFRQVLFGIAAAAITFGIGRLIGVSLA